MVIDLRSQFWTVLLRMLLFMRSVVMRKLGKRCIIIMMRKLSSIECEGPTLHFGCSKFKSLAYVARHNFDVCIEFLFASKRLSY